MRWLFVRSFRCFNYLACTISHPEAWIVVDQCAYIFHVLLFFFTLPTQLNQEEKNHLNRERF